MELHDGEFMTAKDKALVLKQWERFLKNGLRQQDFSDRLYKHLSLHCMFIAHFDRYGFYATYFENPDDTVRFLGQFDADTGYGSVEYGRSDLWMKGPDHADVNGAMCDVFARYKDALYAALKVAAKAKDLGRAKALLEKHGISITVPQ